MGMDQVMGSHNSIQFHGVSRYHEILWLCHYGYVTISMTIYTKVILKVSK